MRADVPRVRRQARSHVTRMRSGTLFHLMAAFFLFAGLLAPFATSLPTSAAPSSDGIVQQRFVPVAAPRPGSPPPIPAPQRVVAIGDFQPNLGCGSYDSSCSFSELTQGDDGIWRGAVPVPPGSYAYRIAVQTQQGEVALGEDGDPNGDDLTVDVPGDAFGIFFTYNHSTGEIAATPYQALLSIQFDGLGTFDLAPIGRGQWEGYFDSPGGQYTYTVLADGQPTEVTGQINLDVGRVRVVLTPERGEVQAETVQPGSFSAYKTDEAGNPLVGSCFAIYDNNDVLGQACDSDDSFEDGNTTIFFPNGAPTGSYELVETFTPDGQPEAEDQDVPVGPGQGGVQVIVSAAPSEAPSEEPLVSPSPAPSEEPTIPVGPGEEGLTVRFIPYDAVTNDTTVPLPGACYELQGPVNTGPVCDGDDGTEDGIVTFEGLPAGTYRLFNPQAPTGYEPYADNPALDLTESMDFQVPHQPSQVPPEESAAPEASEAPSVAPSVEPGATTGVLVIETEDANGDPLPGAGFDVQNETGYYGTFTDEADGSADGIVTIPDVFPGPNTIYMVIPPTGQQLLPEQAATVEAGATTTVTFSYAEVAPPEASEAPSELPSEEPPPTERERPEASPSEAAEGVTLTLTTTDRQTGQPLEGSCYQLQGQDAPVCDADDGNEDGTVTFENVAPGFYDVVETQAPNGYLSVGQFVIEVFANDTPYNVPHDIDPNAPPSAEPSAAASAEPSPSAEETGDLVVLVRDPEGNPVPDACFALRNPETGEVLTVLNRAGGEPATEVCDADGDVPDDGRVGLFAIPAGEYRLVQNQAADGYVAAQDTSVQITAGEPTTEVTVTNEPEAPPAPETTRITILIEDQNGDLVPDACFQLQNAQTGETVEILAAEGGEPTGEVCDGDNGNNDGIVDLYGIAPGEYVIVQTDVADNHAAAPNTSVTVQDQPVEVTVQNLLLTEITIERQDGDGNRVGGSCLQVQDEAGNTYGPFCDNGDEDQNEDPGVIELAGIPADQLTVTETQAPEGVQPLESQTINTAEDDQFTFQTENEITYGELDVRFLADGQPVAGGCVRVTNGFGDFGPFCDAQFDGVDDGVLIIPNVETGENTVIVATVPAGYRLVEDQDDSITVDVTEGQTIQAEFAVEPNVGAIELTFTDAETDDPVAGACVTLAPAANPSDVSEPICDDTGEPEATPEEQPTPEQDQAPQDQNEDPGVILLENLAEGDYEVTITTVPEGYELADGEEADVLTLTVVADETTSETVELRRLPPPTGGVRITAVNQGGDDLGLPGACYSLVGSDGSLPEVSPVCDNAEGDQDDADGVVEMANITPGDYNVVITQSPEGYEPQGGADATFPVTIASDAVAEVEVPFLQLPPPTGTVVVEVQDADGNRLEAENACYRLDEVNVEVCDNGDADADPDAGVIQFENIPAGPVTVTEITPPDGYAAADPPSQSVDVPAGDTVTVAFTHEAIPSPSPSPSASPSPSPSPSASPSIAASPSPSPSESPSPVPTESPSPVPSASPSPSVAPSPAGQGNISVQLQDQNGELVPGGCVQVLDGLGNVIVELCDNGEGDADPTDASLLIENLPVGVYQIAPSQVPGEEPAALAAQAASAARNVQVQPNQTVIVIIIIIIGPPPERTISVVVRKTNEVGELIGGACFSFADQEICDNDENDSDGAVGRIRFDNIGTGEYTLVETQAPAGYQPAEDVTITLDDQSPSVVAFTVRNTPLPDQTGDLVIQKTDANGDPLPGACFAFRTAGRDVARACDGDDGADDGTITFSGIDPGTYSLRETVAPPGYALTPTRNVTIVAGETVSLTIRDQVRPGRITITKVDENGDLLPGACFRAVGPQTYEVCDDNDVLGADGVTRFVGLIPGEYTIEETVVPPGYQAPDPVTVTVGPGQAIPLTIENQLLPPPLNVGDLVITKVDQDGNLLPGACFGLVSGSTMIAGPICDGQDGTTDGYITMQNVPAGTFILRETRAPSAAYQPAADSEVTIRADETTEVTVENTLRPGRIQITKVNQQNQPLPGACFDVRGDGQGEQCSGADGIIVFENLTPGTYRVDETRVPSGYQGTGDLINVVVNPGVTTVLRVVNERATPPPNTGTIQIAKFYCLAGKGGEHTVIYDSSDPGPKQLANTQGCAPGDATFTLIRQGNEGGLGEFSIGPDGFFQAALTSGVYNFTEVAPDLPGDASEQVVIYTGQLTQIVVINYVLPPEPEPATVEVVKYTCAPGFQGTIYEDFAQNCTADANLTNNVTFRLTGPVTQRGTTGAGGQTGVVTFTDLPAGNYFLEEELLKRDNTVYAFCGVPPKAPTLKVIGIGLSLTLTAGQNVVCEYFNIPPVVSDNTGSIIVQKFHCPILTPPTGYDFYANCQPQTTPVEFSISRYNGETRDYTPVTTGTTNVDGLLEFSRLQPGTYKLTEVGGQWCYAESDSVNTNGDVVVRPNMGARVFIFNCSPTEFPPNTGAGTTAGLNGIAGAETQILLGLLWPVAAAFIWSLHRRRRTAA